MGVSDHRLGGHGWEYPAPGYDIVDEKQNHLMSFMSVSRNPEFVHEPPLVPPRTVETDWASLCPGESSPSPLSYTPQALDSRYDHF